MNGRCIVDACEETLVDHRFSDSFEGVDDSRIECMKHVALIEDHRRTSDDHGFFVFLWTPGGHTNDGGGGIGRSNQCGCGSSVQDRKMHIHYHHSWL